MSANDLLSFLPQAPFVLVYLFVAAKAVHRPRRATADTALLLGTDTVPAHPARHCDCS